MFCVVTSFLKNPTLSGYGNVPSALGFYVNDLANHVLPRDLSFEYKIKHLPLSLIGTLQNLSNQYVITEYSGLSLIY